MPPVITIVLTLLILGFCAWLVLRFVPLASPFREIIIAVVALAAVFWILEFTGILHTHYFRWR